MTWHELYVQTTAATDSGVLVAALREALIALGYAHYDPFPGGLGTPPGLKRFMRLFVAPPQAAWVRILGQPDETDWPELIQRLSAGRAVLVASLSDRDGGLALYRDGKADADGLAALLTAAGQTEGAAPQSDRPAGSQPALSGELDQFAQSHGVDPGQANRLIDKLTRQVFGKLDRQSAGEAGTLRSKAQALLGSASGPDWNSPAGRQIDASLAQIGLSRTPDFLAVRDAYSAARRLERRPNASLMADEHAALTALPDVLHYTPVYLGK